MRVTPRVGPHYKGPLDAGSLDPRARRVCQGRFKVMEVACSGTPSTTPTSRRYQTLRGEAGSPGAIHRLLRNDPGCAPPANLATRNGPPGTSSPRRQHQPHQWICAQAGQRPCPVPTVDEATIDEVAAGERRAAFTPGHCNCRHSRGCAKPARSSACRRRRHCPRARRAASSRAPHRAGGLSGLRSRPGAHPAALKAP